jgi:hypothetical protein
MPYIYRHVQGPLVKTCLDDRQVVIDSNRNLLYHFDQVPKILNTLKNYCLKNEDEHLCVASRTSAKDIAINLIEMFDWSKYFS